MVTIIAGDFTRNRAISHTTGQTQAQAAIVFVRCFRLKKSIHSNWPNKLENILVRATSVEKRTMNEPNRKKLFAQSPYESVYIFEMVSIIPKPCGISQYIL